MTDAFVASLDRLAERGIDPAPDVYARLFAAHPDLEALFIRDRSGLVRGQMLQVAIETLLDLAGDGAYAQGLLQTEYVNHQNLGVPADAFSAFLVLIKETARDLLGIDWTAETETAWCDLLTRADVMLSEA